MNRRPFLRGLLGLTAWLGLAAAILLLAPTPKEAARDRGPGSTRARNARGAARLFEALSEVGAPVRRLSAGSLPEGPATVLLLEPAPLTETAAMEIEAWLQAGPPRTLLIAASPERLGRFLAAMPRWFGTWRPRLVAATDEIASWEELDLPRRPRVLLPDTVPDTAAGEVGLLLFQRPPRRWQTLAWGTGTEGALLLGRTWGPQGQLLLLSDPRPLQNRWLNRGDNATWALRLLGAHEGVVFDERRATLEVGRLTETELLLGTAPGRALLLAATGLLLAWWLAAAGPARDHRRAEDLGPRGALRRALADLHLERGRPLALLLHARERFHREASRRLGARGTLPPDRLARALAGPLRRPAAEISHLLAGPCEGEEVLGRVRELDALLARLERSEIAAIDPRKETES